MRVTSVTVKRNRSEKFDRFSHKHVEVSVDVAKGESVDEAVAYASFVVDFGLGLKTEASVRAQRSAGDDERFLRRMRGEKR